MAKKKRAINRKRTSTPRRDAYGPGLAQPPKTSSSTRGKFRLANPAIPRGKWINAKIRVTKNGTIQAKVPKSAVR